MYGSATARSLPTGKKQRIADLLSQIIETLDLTKTQYANIESAYNGVDTFLSEGGDSLLQDAVIYPQGSVRRRTHPRDFGRPQQHCVNFGRRYDNRNQAQLIVYQYEKEQQPAYPWGVMMPTQGQRRGTVVKPPAVPSSD